MAALRPDKIQQVTSIAKSGFRVMLAFLHGKVVEKHRNP
jgi:hypothetical protein